MGEEAGIVLTAPESSPGASGGESRRTRVRVVLVVLGLVAVAAAVGWYIASTSTLATGSISGPGAGLTALDDGIATTKWLQTDEVGSTYFSVRNDGRFPVVLTTTPVEDPSTNIMPRRQVGLALVDWRVGGFPDWPQTPALSGTVTVAPGEEAYVVYRVAYPRRCLQADALNHDPAYYWSDSITLDASTLGRTTRLEVPLNQPVYTPSNDVTCELGDFAAIDALLATSG